MRVTIALALLQLSKARDLPIDRQHLHLEVHLDQVAQGRRARAVALDHTDLHHRVGSHLVQGAHRDQALQDQVVRAAHRDHSEVVDHLAEAALRGARLQDHQVHVHLRDRVLHHLDLRLGEEVSKLTLVTV